MIHISTYMDRLLKMTDLYHKLTFLHNSDLPGNRSKYWKKRLLYQSRDLGILLQYCLYLPYHFGSLTLNEDQILASS